MLYVFTTRTGKNDIFSAEQLIENARQQQAQGFKPCFRRWFGPDDYSAPGYLVYSGDGGCAVCILYDNGNGIIMTGFQGDFVFKSA